MRLTRQKRCMVVTAVCCCEASIWNRCSCCTVYSRLLRQVALATTPDQCLLCRTPQKRPAAIKPSEAAGALLHYAGVQPAHMQVLQHVSYGLGAPCDVLMSQASAIEQLPEVCAAALLPAPLLTPAFSALSARCGGQQPVVWLASPLRAAGAAAVPAHASMSNSRSSAELLLLGP